MPQTHGSTWERIDPPRALTEWETAVLERLAPESAQDSLDGLRVFGRCPCGCASISFVPALRRHFLIADADFTDDDGTHIWMILFGSEDGRELDELEIQRADGEAIRILPTATSVFPKPRA